MSNPEKVESHMPDTRDIVSEASNKEKTLSETQDTSLNDSQDFHLIDTGEDESMKKTELPEDGKQVSQKLIEQQNLQSQSSNVTECNTNDKLTTGNDQDNATVEVKETIIDESVEKTEENVCSNTYDMEKKAELSDNDEDEVIQGTPPHSYTPSKKPIGDIEGASLKRKSGSFDEQPLTKVLRTTSMEDVVTAKIQPDEEESRQSCKSDDSYDDLFKNIQQNVVIEETQDPDNEFTQILPTNPVVRATEKMNNDGTQSDLHLEQIGQQQDGVHSEKCCDVDKNENLNVSAKLSDTSANDSILVNVNSLDESDMQIDENNTSIETKKNITSSNIILDKEPTDVSNETEKSSRTKDVDLEPEKIADDNKEISLPETKKISSPDENAKITIPCKSRTSVELIFDGAHKITVDENISKPEIVEIDDDGEKIVLDSSEEIIDEPQTNSTTSHEGKHKLEVIEINDSHEDGERIVLHCLEASSEVTTVDCNLRSNVSTSTTNESSYKSCIESKNSSDFSYKTLENTKESSLDSKTDNRMMNGSSDTKRSDGTLSVESDTFSGCETPVALTRGDSNAKKTGAKADSFDRDPSIELVSISDQEHDANDSARKSDLIHSNVMTKAVQIEREIGIYVKLKCLLQIDESTKEYLNKELTTVQCEPASIESAYIRQKNDDTASLADISDNKDSSPGSVNSNAQLYHLNPSRLSIMSSISSSSSASSAASLAAKLALKDSIHFSLPRGPAKHAKKLQEILPSPSLADKQTLDESYERLTREWTNNQLLTTTILNYVNVELSALDACNVSNERLDLQNTKIHSSTPSTKVRKTELSDTPKSTRKGMKRHRGKMRPSAQTNGENKNIATAFENDIPYLHDSVVDDCTPSRKRMKTEIGDVTPSTQLLISDIDVSTNVSPLSVDDLIDKEVFAKWSDNNYYPGTVIDRFKTKYKVNFYDGKTKTLIPEFVVPIPKTLKEGLSVYATTQANDYGSCGIIIDVQSAKNGDVYYTVETDEGERLRVQVKDIFLSSDQAQVLKEEVGIKDNTLTSTPKLLAQVSLDNMVDGKRRSKRIGTPVFSTSKSKSSSASGSSASKTKSEPSVSGMASKLKRERNTVSENEVLSSDSNIESAIQDEYELLGVQQEIIGTPYEQVVKGPQSRIKSKRVKKKTEDEQTIANHGPIPSTDSGIFDGMSFILVCVLNTNRYQDQDTTALSTETDTETDNEENWMKRPFVRDRLRLQITAGGGKIYEEFDDIPKDEYRNTKLITNVPNTTAKSILCLSVGIPAYHHKWIIRCCSEKKLVNAAEEALPTGWSLQKQAYVEAYQASENKPLSEIVIIIPCLMFDKFALFWRQVCENAGAVVLIIENAGNMKTMDFDSDVVIVSNKHCPSWIVDRANQLLIPILSTTWVIQCLIEGKLCSYDQHPRYKYKPH